MNTLVENELIFTEILKMTTENFYKDFEIKNIVIKAKKDDFPRVFALKNNGFHMYEEKSIIKYDDYYFKRR